MNKESKRLYERRVCDVDYFVFKCPEVLLDFLGCIAHNNIFALFFLHYISKIMGYPS